jgi:hypothetical protein
MSSIWANLDHKSRRRCRSRMRRYPGINDAGDSLFTLRRIPELLTTASTRRIGQSIAAVRT